MNTGEDTHIESLFQRQVMEVGSLAKAGQYSRAISTIRNAKGVYPKNIFIIALEKQLEKLLALTYSPTLSDPERQKEILGSIPSLAQRAVEQMNSEGPLPTTLPTPHSKERDLAFKKLKEQYFQLADGYMQGGEYQSALEEIKRVLILDPDDGMADEYEEKIKECIALNVNMVPLTSSPTLQVKQPGLDSQPTPPLQEKVVPKAKQPVRREKQENVAEEKTQRPVGRMSPLSRILLAVGIPVILVALATVFLLLHSGSTDSTPITNSPVVNKPVVSKSAALTVTKTESEKTEPGVLPDSQASSNVNGLQFPNMAPPDPKPAVVPGSGVSEGTPLPVAGASAPSIKPTKATPDVNASSGASKASAQLQTVPTTDPGVAELVYKREPKTPDLKTPPLAKVEVPSPTPAGNSRAEAPPPITYSERSPEIIRLVDPKFPAAAWSAGIEGEVVVKVQIGPDGKPIQAKIVKSSNELFNDAVIEAALKSRYSPGMMPTGPVTTWLQMPFTFRRKAN